MNGVNVSVSVKNATVFEILDQVLKGSPLGYHIVDNVIVVSPKKGGEISEPSFGGVSGVVKDEKGQYYPG